MKALIQSYISNYFHQKDITHTSPLFTSGRLDSFGVLELISFLEEQFKIEVDTAKHSLEEFDTIDKIETLVLKLQKSQ